MNQVENSNIKIRLAKSDELAELQQVKPELDEATFTKRLEMQNKGEAQFLILEVDQNPAAFVLLKWFGKPTHPEYPDIEDLYTKADKRGKGYASILIDECLKLAKEKGFKKVGMAVNPDERCPAHRLYSKLGFKNTGENQYVDGVYNGVEDWVIDMAKDI